MIHFFSSLTNLKNFAGFPATIAFGGTSFVTTLPAPTIAFSPIVTLHKIVEPEPIDAPSHTRVFSTFQSASVCKPPPLAVAHKHVVLDVHSFADKCVARNLAAPPHSRILLYFHKRADLRFISDFAAV